MLRCLAIMDDDPNTLLQMFSDIQELAKRLREQLCETFSIDNEDMDMHKQVSALMEYFEPNTESAGGDYLNNTGYQSS